MRALPLLALLVACAGDDDPTPPPATGDTDLSSSAEPTGDTAPETVDTGWECNNWYDCQDCGVAACGPQLNACVGSGACGQALNAWAACVLDCGNPTACADSFSGTGGQAPPLRDCTEAACPVECGL